MKRKREDHQTEKAIQRAIEKEFEIRKVRRAVEVADEYAIQSERHQFQLKDANRQLKSLKQQLDDSQGLTYQLQEQLSESGPTSSIRTSVCIDQNKRTKGKKLTDEERRAVLHCYQMCVKEKANGKSVATADPFSRTASYFGISQNTIRDAVFNRNIEDRRGRQTQFNPVRLLASDIRQRIVDLNIAGQAVTLNRLHRYIMGSLPCGSRTPSRESIRKLMCQMGFEYKNVGKTKNFIDSLEIKTKRRQYLQQR
ncbi:hypothetical protein BGX27_001335, partial [Mortierella sp. AM989]